MEPEESAPIEASRESALARDFALTAEFARTYTRNALARDPSLERLVRVSVKLQNYSDKKLLQMAPNLPPLACKEGCTYCCHQPLGLTAIEVFELEGYIRATFSEDEISALLDRIDANDPPGPNSPCPLLVDSRCSVYEARPYACRAQHSFDVEPCKNYLLADPPPFMLPNAPIMTQTPFAVRQGLADVLVEHGFSIYLLDAGRALRLVLKDPGIADRWLAGEDVFAEAYTPGHAPSFVQAPAEPEGDEL